MIDRCFHYRSLSREWKECTRWSNGITMVSVADPRRGVRDAHTLSVQILSFSCGFWPKICKIIGWCTAPGSWQPPRKIATGYAYSGGSRISPRMGRQLPGGRQHMILPKFPQSCMKLKEFGPPGGRASLRPLRSATGLLHFFYH